MKRQKNNFKYKIYVKYVGDFNKLCSICKTPLDPISSQAVLVDIKLDKAVEGGHYGCINNEMEKRNGNL